MRSMTDEGCPWRAYPSPDPRSGATLSRKGRGSFVDNAYADDFVSRYDDLGWVPSGLAECAPPL
jgi:hypothetical protein